MKKSKPKILWVEILECKPNPMFSEQMRQSCRFLRYSQHVPCAECGRKRKVQWTMLCEFYAHSLNKVAFVIGEATRGKKHQPLTPVCSDHPIGPAWMENNNGKQMA